MLSILWHKRTRDMCSVKFNDTASILVAVETWNRQSCVISWNIFHHSSINCFYVPMFINPMLSTQQLWEERVHSVLHRVLHTTLMCTHIKGILVQLYYDVSLHCAHRQYVWKCFCIALVKPLNKCLKLTLKSVCECVCACMFSSEWSRGISYYQPKLPKRTFHLCRAEVSQRTEKNQQIKCQLNTRISRKVNEWMLPLNESLCLNYVKSSRLH